MQFLPFVGLFIMIFAGFMLVVRYLKSNNIQLPTVISTEKTASNPVEDLQNLILHLQDHPEIVTYLLDKVAPIVIDPRS